jgi:hypothetical protein
MVRVASIVFSSNPNVEEARIEIHRESRGNREVWFAQNFPVDFLPFPLHAILQNFEIPLRFLAAKDQADPMEFGDSRGLERAVADLLQLLDADSGSLVMIETEWFTNFEVRLLCEELSQRIFPIRSNWAQLRDRLLEDEDEPFDVAVHGQILSEVLSLPDVVLNEDDSVQISRKVLMEVPLPNGVAERTGIILNSRAWVMLAGNPWDRIFVPFYLEWSENPETFSEVLFVPETSRTPLDEDGNADHRVRSSRTPSGSLLFFTQSETDFVGSVRIEPEMLPRPYYEGVCD